MTAHRDKFKNINKKLKIYYALGSVKASDDTYTEWDSRILGVFFVSDRVNINALEHKIADLYLTDDVFESECKIDKIPYLEKQIYCYHHKKDQDACPSLQDFGYKKNSNYGFWVDIRGGAGSFWFHDCVWSDKEPSANSLFYGDYNSRSFKEIDTKYIYIINKDSDITNLKIEIDRIKPKNHIY